MLTRAVARQVADEIARITHPFATCRVTKNCVASLKNSNSLQLPLVSHTTISPKLSFAFSLPFQFLSRAPALIRTTLKAISLSLRKGCECQTAPRNLSCNALVSVAFQRLNCRNQCTGNRTNSFRGYAVFVPMVCHENDPGSGAILMELCF